MSIYKFKVSASGKSTFDENISINLSGTYILSILSNTIFHIGQFRFFISLTLPSFASSIALIIVLINLLYSDFNSSP